MSESIGKILFLKVPDANPILGHRVVENLSAQEVQHEFMDVTPDTYEAILDQLEAGVLPVVLKASH